MHNAIATVHHTYQSRLMKTCRPPHPPVKQNQKMEKKITHLHVRIITEGSQTSKQQYINFKSWSNKCYNS